MTPRNEKIAFVAALLLSASAAWGFWTGAPQFAEMANEWSLPVPGYAEPFFKYHKVFVLLPVLVLVAWLLPQARKKRGWICVGLGLISILIRELIWAPFLAAPGIGG
jgi:hypothetical protein